MFIISMLEFNYEIVIIGLYKTVLLTDFPLIKLLPETDFFKKDPWSSPWASYRL